MHGCSYCGSTRKDLFIRICSLSLSFTHPPHSPFSTCLFFLFSNHRGNHEHPRGGPVMCHHAKNQRHLSLGHWEGDHLISPSSLSVHLLQAQSGDEPDRLFVCCPPDVACPRRGFSFLAPLTVPDIFPVFLERSHCRTCEDADRLAGWQMPLKNSNSVFQFFLL